MKKHLEKNKLIFVFIGLKDHELITDTIKASSKEEALVMFKNTRLIDPIKIIGPFSDKVVKIDLSQIKFKNNKPIRAYYENFVVNAFILSDPEDYAYIVYLDDCVDRKNKLEIIPTYNLRFINEWK